ncbi:hypothetical protein EBR96_08665 [bacterium]|nr:hypothetical protein [bacterium]
MGVNDSHYEISNEVLAQLQGDLLKRPSSAAYLCFAESEILDQGRISFSLLNITERAVSVYSRTDSHSGVDEFSRNHNGWELGFAWQERNKFGFWSIKLNGHGQDADTDSSAFGQSGRLEGLLRIGFGRDGTLRGFGESRVGCELVAN